MKNPDHHLLNLIGKKIYPCNKCNIHLFEFDIRYFSLPPPEAVIEQLICLSSSVLMLHLPLQMQSIYWAPYWPFFVVFFFCASSLAEPHPLNVIALFIEAVSFPTLTKSAQSPLKVMSPVVGAVKQRLSYSLLKKSAL